MYEDYAPKLARLMTEYSQPVRPGQYVRINGSPLCAPMVLALYEAVLRLGANPIVEMRLPEMDELFYSLASPEQLDFLEPIAAQRLEALDINYAIQADQNTKDLNAIDHAKVTRRRMALKPLMAIYQRRTADNSYRWCVAPWPAPANAQDARMGLLAYTGVLYRALRLDQPDPVACWRDVRDQQERLVRWLVGKHHAEVKGTGIDLRFDFTDRPWINCFGDCNLPDGEIFTSPIEDSVNGHVSFNFPSTYTGFDVEGVQVTFKDGRAVELSATRGEPQLLDTLNSEPNVRRLGEFAIGTNLGVQQYMANTLFDEKIGGTIHIAFGMSYPEALGQNPAMVHWDMVHDLRDGGEIWIDGTLFYRAGQFMVE